MSYEKILHAVTDPLSLAALALLLVVGLMGMAYRGLGKGARPQKFGQVVGASVLLALGALILVGIKIYQESNRGSGITQTVGTGNAVAGVAGGVAIGNCPPTDPPSKAERKERNQ